MIARNKIFESTQAFGPTLKALKADQKKIVFTNGCFDILHAGHIDLLEKAKQHGDVLILGLNTDESISALKGNDRPIQDLESRAMVLAGLQAVDYIIPFAEATPIKLIKTVMPDILVKGGDYVVEEIVGYTEVKENSGSVLTIPFLEGYSSSRIINKIKQSTHD